MMKKRFSISFFLVLFLGLSSSTPLEAQVYFGITPIRVEHLLAPGKSDTYVIEVMNRSPSPLRIKVYPLDWYLKEDGNPVFLENEPFTYSCAPWIKVNPQDFRLSPDRNRAIRYQISVPENAEEGGYWTGISFENIPPEKPGEQPRAVFSRGRIVCIIYVKVGKVIPEAKINGIEVSLHEEIPEFDVSIENTGKTYFRTKGSLEILEEGGKIINKIDFPDVPVLRESRRKIKLKLEKKLPPGNYLAFCKLDIGREELIGFKKAFSVE